MNCVSDSLKWVVAAAVVVGLGLASAHAQDARGSDEGPAVQQEET
jgi:hypothetical protein